jgi:E3 ubiquitin-protein ligase MARCH6
VDAAEPYFAAIGQEVRLGTGQLRLTWTQLALGHGPKELVFAVALGYIVVMVLISLYLNLLTVGNMKTAGRAVRTAVREQLLVLKVRDLHRHVDAFTNITFFRSPHSSSLSL